MNKRVLYSYLLGACFLVGLALMSLQTAQARMMETIAAVVNESAITVSDVADRLDMVVISSRLQNTKDIRAKLTPQIIETLIEEQLKVQEATRLEIEVTDEEIQGGIDTIANRNNIPPAEFLKALKNSGVKVQTMRDQVRAEISWNKVVQQSVRPRVNITDSDIEVYIERARENIGKAEYLVSEIFLPLDETQSEASIKQLANNLVQEIRKGAPFPRVAQQFSKAAGAQNGGILGWIQEGQLPQELDEVLGTMKKSELSSPIRTISGYHILLVNDQRSISEDSIPTEDQVRNVIGLQRLQQQARRFFLELRADAFIEKRIAS